MICAPALRAQGGFTTVTGTITDSNGLKWSCGFISAQLITAGGASATLNGGGFSTSSSPVQLGCPTSPGTGAPGSFAMRLADSGVINPSNTTWKFTVNLTPGIPPPAGTGPQSFSFTTAINCSTNTPSVCTANAMDISAQLSAASPPLSNGGVGGGGGGNPVLVNQSIDNFNRTGTGLGANWASFLNGVNTTLGPPGFAAGTSATNYSVSTYTAVTSNPTQRVRVGFLTMPAAASAGAALRVNGTPTTSVNFYACIESTTTLAIIRVIGAANASAGTTTTLASAAITGAAGDFVDFGDVGNTLSCMRNGSVANGFLQVNDTTPIASGAPGIFFNSSTTIEIGYWNFLNPLMPSGGTENIVFDGDSIIAANGQGSPQTDPATNFLFLPNATAYAANLGVGGKCLGVQCAAVSGGNIEAMLATGTSVVDPLFVTTSGVKNIVVLFTANNDIPTNGRTPAQVITDMTTYVTNRHAVGWKVLVCQSLSRITTSNPAVDQQEANLAQLISANPFGADAVVNWPYSLTAMGASFSTNLFNADQIHPTELTHVDIFARILSAALSKF